MKKKYERPEMKVVEFATEDIIVTSIAGEGEGFTDLEKSMNVTDIFDVFNLND